MNRSETLQALRRANPRTEPGFPERVEAATGGLRAWIVATADEPRVGRRRSSVRLATAAAALAATAAAAFFTAGLPGSSGRGVEDAAAAIEQAVTVTAASARESGTASVRITHNGEVWGESRIRWNGSDLSVSHPGRPGREMLVVGGILYGMDPSEGGWVTLGSPDSVDPGSGTTPDEYLAAVREDIGGLTVRRITGGLTDLTMRRLHDGSVVYSGMVRAGLIARESGFKEGQPIRVLPFGYVAHDAAADPSAPLDVAVTVGPDEIVRELSVTWGSGRSAWSFGVAYSGLGTTPAPRAPVDAEPFPDRGSGR